MSQQRRRAARRARGGVQDGASSSSNEEVQIVRSHQLFSSEEDEADEEGEQGHEIVIFHSEDEEEEEDANAVTANNTANLVYENAKLRRRVKRFKRRHVQQEQRLETLEEQVSKLQEQLAQEKAMRVDDAATHQKEKQLLSKGMRQMKRELKRERFERIRLEATSRTTTTTRDGILHPRRRGGMEQRPAQGRMTAVDSTVNEGPTFFMVQDCGTAAVNGTFHQDGYFDGACKYVKEGTWNDQSVTFCIFQCTVSNQTRHWYISIFPDEDSPGTSADIDFYTSPVTPECNMIPPVSNWELSQEGLAPPPRVSHTEMHPW